MGGKIMLINGIGMNEMPPSYGGATKTTKAGDEVQFPKKCDEVCSGDQKAMLCQDALMGFVFGV